MCFVFFNGIKVFKFCGINIYIALSCILHRPFCYFSFRHTSNHLWCLRQVLEDVNQLQVEQRFNRRPHQLPSPLRHHPWRDPLMQKSSSRRRHRLLQSLPHPRHPRTHPVTQQSNNRRHLLSCPLHCHAETDPTCASTAPLSSVSSSA